MRAQLIITTLIASTLLITGCQKDSLVGPDPNPQIENLQAIPGDILPAEPFTVQTDVQVYLGFEKRRQIDISATQRVTDDRFGELVVSLHALLDPQSRSATGTFIIASQTTRSQLTLELKGAPAVIRDGSTQHFVLPVIASSGYGIFKNMSATGTVSLLDVLTIMDPTTSPIASVLAVDLELN